MLARSTWGASLNCGQPVLVLARTSCFIRMPFMHIFAGFYVAAIKVVSLVAPVQLCHKPPPLTRKACYVQVFVCRVPNIVDFARRRWMTKKKPAVGLAATYKRCGETFRT